MSLPGRVIRGDTYSCDIDHRSRHTNNSLSSGSTDTFYFMLIKPRFGPTGIICNGFPRASAFFNSAPSSVHHSTRVGNRTRTGASSQSPASSTISSPLHTPIFLHAHSPSTPTTRVPYEEVLLCTTPSSSGQNTRGRKPCIVEGCREHIAPSMWRNRMNAHAKGIFAGSVPTGWLEENGLYKCEQCSQLVAKSHSNLHLQKCTNRDVEFSSDNPPSSSGPSYLNSNSGAFTLDLFTFDEVFKLKCAILSAT